MPLYSIDCAAQFRSSYIADTFFNEDVYSPMKAAQQEHKHTDRNTNVKDRQRTELSKKYKNQDTRL